MGKYKLQMLPKRNYRLSVIHTKNSRAILPRRNLTCKITKYFWTKYKKHKHVAKNESGKKIF